MFEGSVDMVTSSNATGWLYDRLEGRTSEVVATLYGRIIGSTSSTLYRADLQQVGFGNGVCGFDLPFDEIVHPSELPFVVIQPRGSNLSIPRTRDDTFKDFVQHAMRFHPGAGRSRSVLGGLWTDRTDALQILMGRVNVGTCTSSSQDALRRFIVDGFTSLVNEYVEPSTQHASTRNSDLTESLQQVLEQIESSVTESLASLLRSVFDDVPVAYSLTKLDGSSDGFAQASTFDPFTSPVEVVAVYRKHGSTGTARLDLIRDSHEFPEFGRSGRSRWIDDGAESAALIISGAEQPIDSMELNQDRLTVVGPGLLHRAILETEVQTTRILFAPKRNTPVRFLNRENGWQEFEIAHGLRVRI